MCMGPATPSAPAPACNRSSRRTSSPTLYHCLGISADLELRDRLNRPLSLVPWGSMIGDLLA